MTRLHPRVLFFSHPVAGHLHPLLPLARELVQRGYDVAFHVSDAAGEALDKAGVKTVFPCPAAQAVAPPPEEIGREAIADALSRALLWPAVAGLPSAREAVAQFRPDVCVCDPVVYRGVLAAQLDDVPFVVASTTLLQAISPEQRASWLPPLDLQARLDALWQGRGCVPPRFVRSEVVSPLLNVVFATDAFVPGNQEVLLAGPAIWTDRPVPAPAFEMGARLVYVSFGTLVRHEDEVYRKLFLAADGMDALMLVSAGDAAARLRPKAPSNVRVVEYADQPGVLRHARVAITHGGANSTAECLAGGVPTLVSPITFDQPVQAHLTAERGAGVWMDLRTAAAGEVRDALERLLNDPAAAAPHLPAIRDSYVAANAPEMFADALVRVLA